MCSTMYNIKPILHAVDVEYPTCMYKMKNILIDIKPGSVCVGTGVSLNKPTLDYLDKRINEKIQAILKKKLPEMEALESRQHKLLQQLDELRQQIQNMNKDLHLCNKPMQVKKPNNISTQTTVMKKPINANLLQEIVINANPSQIPYSLLAIKNLWRNRLYLDIQCYTHSTIPHISEEVKLFTEILKTEIRSNENLPKLKINLIWKNVGKNIEINSAATKYIPIFGEVNVLRYLSRLGPNEYNYENYLESVNEIDTVLDICYQIINSTNVKQKQNFVRALSNRLGKSNYFGHNHFSTADIAVFSTIKQNENILKKDLTPNLNKWLQNVAHICTS